MTDNVLYVLLKYSKRCSIGAVLLARDHTPFSVETSSKIFRAKFERIDRKLVNFTASLFEISKQ